MNGFNDYETEIQAANNYYGYIASFILLIVIKIQGKLTLKIVMLLEAMEK